ncbi:MAG TPA: hypothetical protein VHC49_09755 [Mycobacteriales bacterium]|nr:hypothetical protein [Mycobacteriales bacterium]
MRFRFRAGLAIGGALALAGVMFTAPPAQAASAPSPISAGQFTVSTTYDQFDSVNSTLSSAMGIAPVHEVMDNANHDRTAASNPGVAGFQDGFRFDSGDNDDCKNYPQGITTTRDAVGTKDSGNYDGHQLVVVSWYTLDACGGKQTRSRITMVDWDATYPNKYRKVLLVEPYTNSSGQADYRDIPIHAGGVSWYGDYLYVADTGHGMRIFDMRKILKSSTSGAAGDIGLIDGEYRAHNYAYVLPQVGTVTAHTTSDTPLVWSTIALDRAKPSIVMTEYTCSSGCTKYPNRAPRAVRFPFAAGGTFAATTTASEALSLPWYGLNGVGSHNGRWWFDSSQDKKLYYWKPGTAAQTFGWVGGGESLSYWEDATKADLLWSLQETAGVRTVFAVTQATYGGG